MNYARLNRDGSLTKLRSVPHISNATEASIAAYALRNGYLPLQETACPHNGSCRCRYQKEGGKIVKVWEKIESRALSDLPPKRGKKSISLPMSNNEEKASWLVGLITGWGIKESWAKVLAGLLLGAASAIGLLASGG